MMDIGIGEIVRRSLTRLELDQKDLAKLYDNLRNSDQVVADTQAEVQAKIEALQDKIKNASEAYALAQKLEASGVKEIRVYGIYDEDREAAVRYAAKIAEQASMKVQDANKATVEEPAPSEPNELKEEQKVETFFETKNAFAPIVSKEGAAPIQNQNGTLEERVRQDIALACTLAERHQAIKAKTQVEGNLVHTFFDGGDGEQHRLTFRTGDQEGIDINGTLLDSQAHNIVDWAVKRGWGAQPGSDDVGMKITIKLSDAEKYALYRAAQTYYFKEALAEATDITKLMSEGKEVPPTQMEALVRILTQIKNNKSVIIQDANGVRGLCEPDMNEKAVYPTLLSAEASKEEFKQQGRPCLRAAALWAEKEDLRAALGQEIAKTPQLEALLMKAMGFDKQEPAIVPPAEIKGVEPMEGVKPKRRSYRHLAKNLKERTKTAGEAGVQKLKDVVEGVKKHVDPLHDMRSLESLDESSSEVDKSTLVAGERPKDRSELFGNSDFYKEDKKGQGTNLLQSLMHKVKRRGPAPSTP